MGRACPRLPAPSPWSPSSGPLPGPVSRERGLGPSGSSPARGGWGFCADGWAGEKRGATGRMVGGPRFRFPLYPSCAPGAGEDPGSRGGGARSREARARRSPERRGRGPRVFAVGTAGGREARRWEPARPRARPAR